MKKFRFLLMGFTILYLFLSVGLFMVNSRQPERVTNLYRVEIHRLLEDLKEEDLLNDSGSISISEYSYVDQVKKVNFLKNEDVTIASVAPFYEYKNDYDFDIQPVVVKGEMKGSLRFDYQRGDNMDLFLFYGEIALFVLYIIIMLAAVYMYGRILKPFNQLSTMPIELSKGHFQTEIKESKNRYFGKFLWGISMLKDTLEAQQQKELNLVRDKKMIILSISHDIKTPLNAINLYAKAIEQGLYETPEERGQATQKIMEKTDEINSFVQEIIQSSTEDIVTIQVEMGEFYLKDLLEKVREAYEEKCRLQMLEFSINSFEDTLLRGDIERLYEVIGNLMENAMKYGDGKRIEISVDEEEYYKLIHVFNTGVQVKQSELSHIMESFYRGSNAEGKPGNGLGLYICQEIMKQMGGEIFAQRKPGGMEVVIVCPIC